MLCAIQTLRELALATVLPCGLCVGILPHGPESDLQMVQHEGVVPRRRQDEVDQHAARMRRVERLRTADFSTLALVRDSA